MPFLKQEVNIFLGGVGKGVCGNRTYFAKSVKKLFCFLVDL